jgi:hypothetical protein
MRDLTTLDAIGAAREEIANVAADWLASCISDGRIVWDDMFLRIERQLDADLPDDYGDPAADKIKRIVRQVRKEIEL